MNRRKNNKKNRCKKLVTIVVSLCMSFGIWNTVDIISAKADYQKKLETYIEENDHSSPIITFQNITVGGVYCASEYIVEVSVIDDYKLEIVEIYVNDKKIEYECQENKDCYTFPLLEDKNSKKIEIMAIDKAGNRARTIVEDIYVSRNIFVRLANDTEFLIQLIGLFMLMGGMAIIIIIQYQNEKFYQKIYSSR